MTFSPTFTLDGGACGMHTNGSGGEARVEYFSFALPLLFMGGLGEGRKGCRQLYTPSGGATGIHASG